MESTEGVILCIIIGVVLCILIIGICLIPLGPCISILSMKIDEDTKYLIYFILFKFFRHVIFFPKFRKATIIYYLAQKD